MAYLKAPCLTEDQLLPMVYQKFPTYLRNNYQLIVQYDMCTCVQQCVHYFYFKVTTLLKNKYGFLECRY